MGQSVTSRGRGGRCRQDVVACAGVGGSGPGISKTPGSSARFGVGGPTTSKCLGSSSFLQPFLPRVAAACHNYQEHSEHKEEDNNYHNNNNNNDQERKHHNLSPPPGVYHDFFPQELLEGSPYKIRVIEHEDFIDYEIEFVEMRDEDGGKDDDEDEYQYEYYNEEEAFNPIASPADAGLTSGFGITFMDLLERARQQHKVGTTTARPENKARARGGGQMQ